MHVITSEFQKFSRFPECSLGCLAAMDYFPVLLWYPGTNLYRFCDKPIQLSQQRFPLQPASVDLEST
jgi:hypothetical protein